MSLSRVDPRVRSNVNRIGGSRDNSSPWGSSTKLEFTRFEGEGLEG